MQRVILKIVFSASAVVHTVNKKRSTIDVAIQNAVCNGANKQIIPKTIKETRINLKIAFTQLVLFHLKERNKNIIIVTIQNPVVIK
jgi:hypothetical protein